MQEITIDQRTEADADEVLELLVTVFDDTERAWYEAGRLDPPYPESTGFVARAGRRIVSHVELLEMPLRYGEVVVPMGGISGVATLPEWRRQGLASALMQRLIAEMAARQMPLALLGTGSQAFYERLGWTEWQPPGRSIRWQELGQREHADAADQPANPRRSTRYTVTPYAPTDLGEMMALHERYSAARPGTLLRPERYWQSVMVRWLEVTEYPGMRNSVHVARRGGRLVAYCFAFTEEDDLYLSELAYDEAEAVAPLMQAAIAGIGEPAPRRLVATLPWDSAALEWMGERSEPVQPFGWMWRINDLAGLLRQIRPVLEQRLVSAAGPVVEAEAARLVLSSDRGGVALEVRRNGLRFEPSPGPGALSRCRLAQNDLVTLILGSYASPQWLDSLGLPEEARPWLERLFPPAGGVFWLTDNF
jgi:predicted N-acetyltransferase YhbS